MAYLPEIKDFPICAKCNKPVETITVLEHAFINFQTSIIFIVHCHGETERIEIPETILLNADVRTMKFGEAFVEKRLLKEIV